MTQLNRRDLLKLGVLTVSTTVLSSLKGSFTKLQAFTSSDEELIYLPASEQLKLFKAKKLSPVEVLQAQIKRTEAVESKINVFTYQHFEEALTAAKESEKRYMQGNPRSLEGITVALKDEHDRVGWITTAGSVVFKDNVAKKNDPIVEKLIEAGAVMHAQTTVPEMYFAGVTWTQLWGVTRNPWNLKYTVGGSSGGSGGALAAGMTTLATGSDMGGSIRIPCAFNGLYGFKPPYGRVPMTPDSIFLFPAGSGPMARTFEDMVLFQNVISGPAPYVITSLRPKLDLPLQYPNIRGMKIAYTMDQGWAQIDADTRKNTENALKVLEAQGAIVEPVDLELNLSGSDIRQGILNALLSGFFGAYLSLLNDYKDQLTSYGRYVAEVASQEMGPQQAKEAAEISNFIYKQVEEKVFLKGYEAIVMPTLATSAIEADADPITGKVIINGKEVDPLAGWVLTPLWNLLNWNPVVAVPTGLDSNNMPTGMQIATKTYDDVTAMQIASAYSQGATPLYQGDLFPTFI